MLTSVFSEELSGMAILDLKYRGAFCEQKFDVLNEN